MGIEVGGSVDAAEIGGRAIGDAAHGEPRLGVGVHAQQENEAHWEDIARDMGRGQQPAPSVIGLNEAQNQARDAMAAWAAPHEEVPVPNAAVAMRQGEHAEVPAVPEQRPLDRPAGDAAHPEAVDLVPPEHLAQEPQISRKLDEHGTPEMRQKLDNVNKVMREQYALLKPEVDRGHLPKASLEQRITAANAGSAINHMHDALDNLRRSVSKATTPDELNEAITKYGIQSSMIGGSLGKTVMGARTLMVRQQSLRIAGYSLATAGVSGALAAAAIGLTASHQNSGNGKASNAADGGAPSGQ